MEIEKDSDGKIYTFKEVTQEDLKLDLTQSNARLKILTDEVNRLQKHIENLQKYLTP